MKTRRIAEKPSCAFGIIALGFAAGMSLVTSAAGQAETPTPPDSAEGRLTVELEPLEITVGDRVKARLTLRWRGPQPTTAPRFPRWQETWGRAEILHAGNVEVIGGEKTDGGSDGRPQRLYRQELVLTVFETGNITLPKVTVNVPLADRSVDVGLTRDLELEVHSILPGDGLDQVPRQAAPPRSLAGNQRFVWTATALVSVSLALAFLLVRRLNTVAQTPPMNLYGSPLDELQARLDRLDATHSEPAHTGLSLCLRGFLARQLGFAATESTSREIRGFLEHSSISASLAGSLIRLLLQCDEVKFAQLTVPPETTEERLQAAHALAREVESELAPPDIPEPETSPAEIA